MNQFCVFIGYQFQHVCLVLSPISDVSPKTALDTVKCLEIIVRNANYANCNGLYQFVNTTHVTWAPNRPVYKHKSKNR